MLFRCHVVTENIIDVQFVKLTTTKIVLNHVNVINMNVFSMKYYLILVFLSIAKVTLDYNNLHSKLRVYIIPIQ